MFVFECDLVVVRCSVVDLDDGVRFDFHLIVYGEADIVFLFWVLDG